ncbi:MAG: transcription elongation factor GreA [Christensenellales bacterium]
MKEVYLTQEGLEELKQRLDYLIVYLRGDVAQKLQHARELGDLSENAEYDAAKQEESQVASEIKELEERIKNAVIIEKSGTHKVSIGNTITVEYLGELEEDEERVMQFQLVGETEADFAKGKLSNESPLGKAVVGKKTGEIVRFSTAQGGVEEYKVLNIK